MLIEFVNISIMASWLVLAILLIRIIFKKIPKWINCLLWSIVGLRLILPFSIESTLSLVPSNHTIDMSISEARPTIQSGIQVLDQNVNHYISSHYYEGVTLETDFFDKMISELTIIWIIGIILMGLYAFYSYYKIHKQVQASIIYKENIYLCDDIDTPFILGIFNPKIYLPSTLDEKQMSYVLKHEQAHIIRKDHFYKPLGYMLLSIYWFNPILWIAYIFLCRDIEAACDEKVIKDMNNSSKKEYSETLFACSVQRNMILVCPLAFGEVGVKERIKSIVNYKKPSFWIILLSLILCIGISIGFLTVPRHNRIVDINDPATHITLLDNVTDIIFTNHNIEVSKEDEVNELVNLLLKVEISNSEISQSRSEDRDKTNQIGLIYNNLLDRITTINFNSNYTQVWLDDGVKPTFSYKVENPSFVKQIFSTYQSKEITKVSESMNAQVIGFENGYIVVEPFENEDEAKISNRFYITEDVINESMKFKVSVGSHLEIVYDGNIFKKDHKILNIQKIHLLNIIMNENYNSNYNGFITSTIIEYYRDKKSDHSILINNQEYIVLGTKGNIAFNTNEAGFKEYLVVLNQEYNVKDNQLMIENSYLETMEISYKVYSGGQYTLDSIYTTTNQDNIKNRFPNSCVEDALNFEQYRKQLSAQNLDNVYYYLSVFEKELYDTLIDNIKIINSIKEYDNGYTDEDYNNAQGEKCLHPRVKYSSGSIEVEIWSDPHRLFCYIVKIRDLNKNTLEKIYVNSDKYEELRECLDNYHLIKSYM